MSVLLATNNTRLFTVVLAVVAAVVFISWLRWKWEVLPVRVQRIGAPFAAMLLWIAYGSGEAWAQDAPTGLRVSAGVFLLVWLIVALLYPVRSEPTAPWRWRRGHTA